MENILIINQNLLFYKNNLILKNMQNISRINTWKKQLFPSWHWYLLSFCLAFSFTHTATAQGNSHCLKPLLRYADQRIELYVPCGFDAYQWYRNDKPIPGATKATYQPDGKGTFHAAVTCTTAAYYHDPATNEELKSPFQQSFAFYPNPAKNQLNIIVWHPKNVSESSSIELIAPDGKSIRKEPVPPSQERQLLNWDISQYPAGRYFLIFRSESLEETHALMIN